MEEKNMHSHEHEEEGMALWQIIMSAVMLVTGMLAHTAGLNMFDNNTFSLIWYVIAFIPVGLPVMKEAWEAVVHDADFFSEFMLMSLQNQSTKHNKLSEEEEGEVDLEGELISSL